MVSQEHDLHSSQCLHAQKRLEDYPQVITMNVGLGYDQNKSAKLKQNTEASLKSPYQNQFELEIVEDETGVCKI